MEPANGFDSTGQHIAERDRAFQEARTRQQLRPQAGRSLCIDIVISASKPNTRASAQQGFDRKSPHLADCNPLKFSRKNRERNVRFLDGEAGIAARERDRVAKRKRIAERSESRDQLDPDLIATMILDDNTQPTQEYTDPRRLGRHGSGISEEDAANVICILHPSSPTAHEAVAAASEQNPNHVIPNADLLAEEGESMFDPAVRIEHSTREIALRLSSQVKNRANGFTFGRNPEKCDILLARGGSGTTLSNRHFRIYLTKDGVLMLQDTSSNGTVVDESHLGCKKGKKSDEASRMLQNGSVIFVGKDIKFLVRVPNRGDCQGAYNANLARYVASLPGPKSRLVVSDAEQTYGMHWNGGSVYNVVGCLGKGAFATVYKLATKNDGNVYAAKELDKRRFLKNGILDMKFDNEIKIMKGLRHPNIVQYEDYHDYEDWAYIIMEIVPGGELSTYMHKNGPLSEFMVQSVARQVLHALAYLHARGITHRDIKPDNILIAELDPLHVKLSDFGLSKCIADQETFLKTFCGTLLYCAPEIYPGYGDYHNAEHKKRRRPGSGQPKRYSERVDMWSFGAVLFHLLCNNPPVLSNGEDKAAKMLSNIMTKAIDFGPLLAMDVSEEAIDFISNLLKRSPGLRPTPKACFQHAWIAEVADAVDYMNLDDEMPTYRGQGLATVDETDEDFSTGDHDAPNDNNFGAIGDLSFGYLNTAGQRVSKRQRIVPKGKAVVRTLDEVAYPQLPQVPLFQVASPNDTRGERLFGEVTTSVLRSSGVFPSAPPLAKVPAAQHEVQRIGINDFATFESSEPPPSAGESSVQHLQYPQTCGVAGAAPSSAPSLFGAETQINQLHMTSPEAATSEATTPDTANPMTPEVREGISALAQDESSNQAGSPSELTTQEAEEPEFSRYIDIRIPESLAWDTDFVKAFDARQVENKARRARKAQARLAELERQKQSKFELTPTVNTSNGHEARPAKKISQRSHPNISRRIEVPKLESLCPTSVVTPDGFTQPLRRFGKLTTTPGSYLDLTIYINSRLTSWGRGVGCNAPYEDKQDVRIPHYAVQITYHAPDMHRRLEKGLDWVTAPGIHTVVSAGPTRCIWVNDVELRMEDNVERCAYYGKVYTGDIITVYKSHESNGPYLKFRVEMNYGDSARKRPASEPGFQVTKDKHFYEIEMKRRERRKTASKESSVSGSPPKVVKDVVRE